MANQKKFLCLIIFYQNFIHLNKYAKVLKQTFMKGRQGVCVNVNQIIGKKITDLFSITVQRTITLPGLSVTEADKA